MSVFTSASSSNQDCSLSKTSNKASSQNTSSSNFGFLDAIFGCFTAKSKSRQLPKRPTTPLLGPQHEKYNGKKTLVIDLDETLVHTSNTATGQCFRNVCMRFNNQRIFTAFRPGAKEFLKRMGAIYEIVIFTASLQNYAEQVIKALDDDGVVAHSLYREACTMYGDKLVKDLSRLSRPLKDIIILDNSTFCYDFHPTNGLNIADFIDDPKDNELAKMIPFLEMLATVNDVRPVQSLHEEHHRATAKSHKNLRINTLTTMRTLTSTEGHLTPATIPMKSGKSPMTCASDKLELKQDSMPEGEKVLVQ